MTAATPAASSTNRPGSIAPGTGGLRVECLGGRSLVRRAFASSPLKLLTPRNHGHAAWVYAATYRGGLVGGDRIDLDVDVGPAASLLLSTQASTKVYRSPHGSRSVMHARVSDGGLLVVMPDPVVCFAASTYHQEQDVALDGGASLILVDWMTSGRQASGERWAFDSYAARSAVRRGGRLAFYDAVSLRADDGALEPRFRRFSVLATVVLLGPRVHEAADAVVAGVARLPVPLRGDLVMAASPLAGGGCVLRLAATSTALVAGAIRTHLAFLPALLGDDPWARKW